MKSSSNLLGKTVLMSVMALALACGETPRSSVGGGSGGGGGGGGGGGMVNEQEVRQFCMDFKGKFESFMIRCFGGDGNAYSTFLAPNCDEMVAEVTDGRRSWNRSKRAGCLAVIDALSCEEGFGGIAPDGACAELSSGNTVVDAVCHDNDDCVSGGFCAREDFECPGLCKSQDLAGAPCARFGSECVDDFYCAVVGTSTTGVCTARFAVGVACAGDECATDHTCVNEVCTAAKMSGEACGEDDNCQGFTRCLDGSCQLPVRAGESCNMMSSCSWGPCGSDGKCPEPAGIGNVCGLMGMSYVLCLQGYCDTPDFSMPGSCVAKIASGAACERAGQCLDGACNDGVCGAHICL